MYIFQSKFNFALISQTRASSSGPELSRTAGNSPEGTGALWPSTSTLVQMEWIDSVWSTSRLTILIIWNVLPNITSILKNNLSKSNSIWKREIFLLTMWIHIFHEDKTRLIMALRWELLWFSKSNFTFEKSVSKMESCGAGIRLGESYIKRENIYHNPK